MGSFIKTLCERVCEKFFKYFELIRFITYILILFALVFSVYTVLNAAPYWTLSAVCIFIIMFVAPRCYSKLIGVIKASNKKKSVVIIGSGISGIAAAYYLQKKNIPYTILEKASDLGGTWRDHKFHGCKVDTENVEYCYSFEILMSKYSTNWYRREILEYLTKTAKKYNIFSKIEFNKKVTSANFDTTQKQWLITTDDGNTCSADFMYNCSGFANTNPYIPDFKGRDNYNGEIVHSIDLDEKRTFYKDDVVIIGSGATMASMAPELAKVCKSLTIVQRSPSYIFESDLKPDFIWQSVRKLDLIGIPGVKYLYQIYRTIDGNIVYQLLRSFQYLGQKFFRKQWETVASNDFIDKHLTPRYNLLEQRIAVSTGLKELIRRQDIKFETGEISHFSSNGIYMKSGKLVNCNVCVLATGFDLNFFTFPLQIDNIPIDTKQINWYKTLLIGGVPNYFHAIGCFDCSWTQRVESAYKLASKIIKHMSYHAYNTVEVNKRTDLENTFVFKPNYILRKKDEIPVIYGISHLPLYDLLFSFNLYGCKDLVYSK